MAMRMYQLREKLKRVNKWFSRRKVPWGLEKEILAHYHGPWLVRGTTLSHVCVCVVCVCVCVFGVGGRGGWSCFVVCRSSHSRFASKSLPRYMKCRLFHQVQLPDVLKACGRFAAGIGAFSVGNLFPELLQKKGRKGNNKPGFGCACKMAVNCFQKLFKLYERAVMCCALISAIPVRAFSRWPLVLD